MHSFWLGENTLCRLINKFSTDVYIIAALPLAIFFSFNPNWLPSYLNYLFAVLLITPFIVSIFISIIKSLSFSKFTNCVDEQRISELYTALSNPSNIKEFQGNRLPDFVKEEMIEKSKDLLSGEKEKRDSAIEWSVSTTYAMSFYSHLKMANANGLLEFTQTMSEGHKSLK